MAAKALDAELNAPTAPTAAAPGKAEVNDLTGLVKKKKKNVDANGDPSPANGSAKRKAEDDADDSQSEKKAKLEETTS